MSTIMNTETGKRTYTYTPYNFEQAQRLASANYSKGGDTMVECIDESDYVPMTYLQLKASFKDSLAGIESPYVEPIRKVGMTVNPEFEAAVREMEASKAMEIILVPKKITKKAKTARKAKTSVAA